MNVRDRIREVFNEYVTFEQGWNRFYKMLCKQYPNLNEAENEASYQNLPNLSDYFVITQKRKILSEQTTAQLALKDLGKRRPTTELPTAIKVSRIL